MGCVGRCLAATREAHTMAVFSQSGSEMWLGMSMLGYEAALVVLCSDKAVKYCCSGED